MEAKKQQSESIEISQQTETNDTVVNELWVEKYKPKSYIDLLSEEPVNRALLHWLHLWDKVIVVYVDIVFVSSYLLTLGNI